VATDESIYLWAQYRRVIKSFVPQWYSLCCWMRTYQSNTCTYLSSNGYHGESYQQGFQSSPEKVKLLPFSGPLPRFLFFRFEDLPSSSLLS